MAGGDKQFQYTFIVCIQNIEKSAQFNASTTFKLLPRSETKYGELLYPETINEV